MARGAGVGGLDHADEAAAQEVEGGLGGELLEGFAFDGEEEAFHEGFGVGLGGEADEDGADGLCGATAAGTGNAGDGEGVVGVGGAEGALGHGGADFGADGTALLDEDLGDAEEVGFGLVGVGDEALGEDGGGTGDVGEAVGEEAAGAGFGGGDGLTEAGEEVDDGEFEGVLGGGEVVGGEGGADDGFGGGELCGGAEEADDDFAGAGAVAEFDVAEGEEGGFEGGGDLGFA